MRARTCLAALLAPALACFNPSGAATSTGPDPGSTGDDASTAGDASTGAGATTDVTSGPDVTSIGATGSEPGCGDGNVEGAEECDDGNQLDDDACRNSCQAAICGDGVACYECGEQCDDGNANSIDDCVDCQFPVSLLIFASPQRYPADQVDPPDADALCDALGKTLRPASTFFAWVGSATFDPRTNIDGAPLDLPYVRGDGKVVATGAADLLDGTLLVPIAADHDGNPIQTGPEDMPCGNPENYAWTGTNFDGYNADPDCDDWTTTTDASKARVGSLLSTTAEWSTLNSCTFTCDQQLHIYCLEKLL